jgi:hypothetical protein
MAVVVKVANGEAVELADTWAFEAANNPDPYLIHSHPYDLEAGPDGMLWVTEAGGNGLIKVDPDSGKIELIAVFDGVISPIPNASRGRCPTPPACPRPLRKRRPSPAPPSLPFSAECDTIPFHKEEP